MWTEILGASCTSPRMSLKDAWNDFLNVVGEAIFVVHCICNRCTAVGFIDEDFGGTRAMFSCPVFVLWKAINDALDVAIAAVFINPGENVSLGRDCYFSFNILRRLLVRNFDSSGDHGVRFGPSKPYETVAKSGFTTCASSCVCYSTELATLQKSSDLRISFELVDGMLVFNGRYFTGLEGDASAGYYRGRAKQSLIYKAENVVPSSLGEHSKLTISIREKLHTLELRAIIEGPNRFIRFIYHQSLKPQLD